MTLSPDFSKSKNAADDTSKSPGKSPDDTIPAKSDRISTSARKARADDKIKEEKNIPIFGYKKNVKSEKAPGNKRIGYNII